MATGFMNVLNRGRKGSSIKAQFEVLLACVNETLGGA